MNKVYFWLALLLIPTALIAADISHTPLVPGALLSTDRVPMGRPSSGLADGKGAAYTASMNQIRQYVQGQLSSAQGGVAATVDVGTTTTGAAGTSASVTNSGTDKAAILNFTVPRGNTGAAGTTGAAATIAVGTVTTGAAGSEVTVTNVGTPTAAVFDVRIPKGDKGDTGNTGATGAQGEAGVQGIQGIPGDQGLEGPAGAGSEVPGPPGAPGDPGLSAYQVAVANGFVGDEAAWLASLQGETGPPGSGGSGAFADITGAPGDNSALAAALGAKVDTSSLAAVATTGAYSDLTGKPTLGNSAALDVGTTAGTVAAGDDARIVAGGTALQSDGDGSGLTGITPGQVGAATAAQGALADSALQTITDSTSTTSSATAASATAVKSLQDSKASLTAPSFTTSIQTPAIGINHAPVTTGPLLYLYSPQKTQGFYQYHYQNSDPGIADGGTFSPFHVEVATTATQETPNTLLSGGLTSTLNFGQGGAASVGTGHAASLSTVIYGNGDAASEHAGIFSALRYDIGTGFAQTAGPSGRGWLTDFNLHGPVNVQPNLLTGINMFANNYYNGSPVSGPSGAIWISTGKGLGGGTGGGPHTSANTYPLDVGLGIVGTSYAGSTANGFNKGIQIGGTGSGWEVPSSKIGTGISLEGTQGVGADFSVATFSNNSTAIKLGPTQKISDGTNAYTLAELAAGGGGGEANTTSNVGTGEGTLAKAKSGVDLPFKTIKAGSNITITNNADDVTVEATGGGAGTVISVSSANADIAVSMASPTPVLTLNSGTSANQIVKRGANGAVTFANSANDGTSTISPSRTMTGGTGAGTSYRSLNSTFGLTTTDSADSGYLSAGGFTTTYNGSGTSAFTGELRSLVVSGYNQGSATASNVTGVLSAGGATSTGGIATYTGFKSAPYSPGAGVITTAIGFLSDSTTYSNATNKWHFYGNGDARSYLNGNLQIGSATATTGAEKLQVTGSASISGNLLAKTFTPTLPSATTYGATTTIDLSLGDSPSVTLTGDPALAFSNPVAGQWHTLNLIQDGTGGRTATWPSSGLVCTWRNTSGNVAPTLLTGANKVDSFVIHTLSTTSAECWTANNQ